MIAGSFASTFHGVPRATHDIDIVIDPSRSALDALLRSFDDGAPTYVATAEDSVIAKLEWAKLGDSERQLRDVQGIIAVRGGSLDHAYIERWVAALGLEAEWDRARPKSAVVR
ncbi:MAG: hypothetical protein ACTHU0_13095 [Kofleriaceae bacterium]